MVCIKAEDKMRKASKMKESINSVQYINTYIYHIIYINCNY